MEWEKLEDWTGNGEERREVGKSREGMVPGRDKEGKRLPRSTWGWTPLITVSSAWTTDKSRLSDQTYQ